MICTIFTKIALFHLLLLSAVLTIRAVDEVKPANILKSGNSPMQVRVKIYSGNEDEFFDEIGIGKFYLLDRDLVMILKESGFEISEENEESTDEIDLEERSASNHNNGEQKEEAFLEAAVRLLISLNNEEIFLSSERAAAGGFWDDFQGIADDEDETALLGLLLLPELKKHTKKNFKLNNPNYIKLLFPRGEFYLFGYAKHQGEIIVWNLPLTIADSPKIIELDQYNSSALFLF